MENKVQFNLKNVHYAKITETGGSITYGTPKAIAGAVNLTLEAQNTETNFYADGVLYYNSSLLSSYNGDLEVARVNDSFLVDIFGLTLGSTSKVLSENINTEPSRFALLFQIDGDADSEYYVFYNCSASKPSVDASTNEESKEPKTQTLTITAAPLSSGLIKARTTSETPAQTKTSWFSQVYQEA